MDYNRKFKCKYCDFRGNREALVSHIENKHPEFVNEDYPASRIVYNYLNNVDTGHCIICGKPTEWNDKTWKYKRHCGSKACKEAIKNTYRQRAIAARGKYVFTDDPKHVEKMLAARKISGTYICRDGSKKTYTGSYERKAIEFMDKVLELDPEDIMMPGPIIKYEYNGEQHDWITDIYFIPYNLIIEVKDGGDNPNRREMPEYRAKQEAKEKAIIEGKKFNYLRLTNNNFEQLLQMFTALRLAMLNDEKEAHETIVKINESLNSRYTYLNTPTKSRRILVAETDPMDPKHIKRIGYTYEGSDRVIFMREDQSFELIKKDPNWDCYIDPNPDISIDECSFDIFAGLGLEKIPTFHELSDMMVTAIEIEDPQAHYIDYPIAENIVKRSTCSGDYLYYNESGHIGLGMKYTSEKDLDRLKYVIKYLNNKGAC